MQFRINYLSQAIMLLQGSKTLYCLNLSYSTVESLLALIALEGIFTYIHIDIGDSTNNNIHLPLIERSFLI